MAVGWEVLMSTLMDSYRKNWPRVGAVAAMALILPNAAYARRDSPYPISDTQLGRLGQVSPTTKTKKKKRRS